MPETSRPFRTAESARHKQRLAEAAATTTSIDPAPSGGGSMERGARMARTSTDDFHPALQEVARLLGVQAARQLRRSRGLGLIETAIVLLAVVLVLVALLFITRH